MVANRTEGTLSVFAVKDKRLSEVGKVAIDPKAMPSGIGFLPDGKTAFTANGPSNDVSVVDLESKQVAKKIKVGDRPWGVAVVSR